eukprot:Phypoly_transcript_22718.p1 GENE.Phypoly_transcript_22718~~Phypoly_transcript_22718.p1  ORF type:complete len:119 (+),score=2.37 Phypoly_transcript_22718:214-570(+)
MPYSYISTPNGYLINVLSCYDSACENCLPADPTAEPYECNGLSPYYTWSVQESLPAYTNQMVSTVQYMNDVDCTSTDNIYQIHIDTQYDLCSYALGVCAANTITQTSVHFYCYEFPPL